MFCVVPPAPTCIAERLIAIILHMCGVVGEHGRWDPASRPFLALTSDRLLRLRVRLTELIAAYREGRLSPPRTRTRPEPPPAPAESAESGSEPGRAGGDGPAGEQPLRLPHTFGWMLRFGWRFVGYRSLFEQWLEDPEVKALVAEAPQAGRILRPLCHMMGIKPPEALRLPKRQPGQGQGSRRRKRGGADAAPAAAEGRAAPVSAPSGPACFARTPHHTLTADTPPTETEVWVEEWLPGQKRPLPFRWSVSDPEDEPPPIRPKRRSILKPA